MGHKIIYIFSFLSIIDLHNRIRVKQNISRGCKTNSEIIFKFMTYDNSLRKNDNNNKWVVVLCVLLVAYVYLYIMDLYG